MRMTTRLIAAACAWVTAGIMASGSGDAVVTAVAGPSHLHRLGLRLQQSSMGWTGRLGPAPGLDSPGMPADLPAVVRGPVMVTGADLYRLNCRGCHRADGRGAGDEVKSLVDPIRSTSPSIMRIRMEAMGRPISAAFARELAAGSRGDVLERLKNGGERMPSFRHLSDAETESLFAYVEWLAGVPGAEHRQRRVAVTAARLGEHLVRGTCHICPDATGPWSEPAALLDGEMPSLAAIARHRPIHDVVTKVRHGKAVTMGALNVSYRGRMPVFDYLTSAEVAAAYRYLTMYPPQLISLSRRPCRHQARSAACSP